MKITLTKISHFDKDKEGRPFTTKDGKPYTRCLLKCVEYGDQLLSGFGGRTTREWKEGQTVDVVVTEKVVNEKTYLNFNVPKLEYSKGISTEQYTAIVDKLDTIIRILTKP